MSMSIKHLRETTDDELVRQHDERAKNTVVGTAYYVDELRRREAERAEAASYELSRRAYWLSVVSVGAEFFGGLMRHLVGSAPGRT